MWELLSSQHTKSDFSLSQEHSDEVLRLRNCLANRPHVHAVQSWGKQALLPDWSQTMQALCKISGHAAAEGAQWLQLNIQCSCNEIMSVLTSSSLSSIPTQSILQYNNSAVNLQASYSKLMGILTRRENINQSNYKAYRGRFGALHCFSVTSNYWIFCSKTT